MNNFQEKQGCRRMRNGFHRRHLLSAAVALASFVVLAGTSFNLRAQSPALSFDAVEGEVWQQLPPVGRGLDTYEHPITTDPFFSDPTGVSGTWACDTSNGFVSRCYPSGTLGVGDSVFPSPIQLQGAIVSCDSDTHNCYPNGRTNPPIPIAEGYGPCVISNYAFGGTDCYPSLQPNVGPRVPPAPGQLAVAQTVAVDNANGDLYVTDHWNHRVQVFRFDGSVVQLTHPIGNGVAHSGAFSYDITANAVTTTYTGESLSYPEGIKIDAARHIVVGDSGNGRVAAFDRSGQYLFELHIPAQSDGSGGRPSGIALSPGGSFKGAGNPAGSRLVVTDKYACTAYIYDAQTLEPAGRGQMGLGNCNNTGDALQPEDLQSVEGAAIDAQGHIYLADYDRNRIEIFDADGNFLTAFGEPPLMGVNPPGALSGPTDVVVDHQGRIVVSDSLNQRLAIYRVTFNASAAPAAAFLFALNAAGDLNGSPNGVAEDLFNDPSGRLVATDSANQRVQRFQLPDLAIVQAQGNGASSSVGFMTTVPSAKAHGVAAATPIICSTTPGITVLAAAAPAGVVCDSGVAYSLTAATLAPGQLAPYSFTFAGTPASATFQIFAVGNPDPAHANTFLTRTAVATVTVSRTCPNCSIAAEVKIPSNVTEPLVPPVPPSTLYVGPHPYGSAVSLHVTATNPAGLKEFRYRFIDGAETSASGQPGVRPPFPVSGHTASFDIPFQLQGASIVEYWAVALDGSDGPHQQAQLRITFNAPFLMFSFGNATAFPNGAGWYHAPFSVPLMFGSGHITHVAPPPTRPASPLYFDREGADVFFSVTIRDAANLFEPLTLNSNDADNGQIVKLDMTAPQFPASASITLERRSYLGAPSSALPSYLVDLAVDPALADGTNGSGVVTVVADAGRPAFYPFPSSPQRFTATDLADNVGSGLVTIVVADTVAPALSCPTTVNVAAGPLGRVFSLPGFSVSDASMIDAPASQPQVAVTQTPPWSTMLAANASVDVVLNATDPSGNRGTCMTRVTASLTAPVHFTRLPGDQTVEGIGPGSLTQPAIDLAATAVDATGAAATVTLSPTAPAKFPVGSTTIVFTAKDGANHTTSMPVVITVTDTTGPKFAACPVAPAPIILASGVVPSIPSIAAGVTATDYNTFSITQTPAAGTVYPLPAGQNTVTVPVTVQATDALQNTSTCAPVVVTFTRPTQPPVLTQPDIVTYATSAAGALVAFTPIVVDAVDGTNHNPVTCTPKGSGAIFPIGTTTVACSATNSVGLTGSVTFKVTVKHSAPVCAAASADPGSLWPPNHKFVPIAIGTVTTADRGASAITVTGVFQDEPTNGLGDGDTAIDAIVVNGAAQVRAERDGGGDGRVYYINFRATTDGGSCTGTVTVGVQKDEGKRTAIGQGPKFDSTVATTPEKTDKNDDKDAKKDGKDEKKDKK
jgi:sugar lactone lactonase YvrE